MSGAQQVLQGTAAIAANGRVDRSVRPLREEQDIERLRADALNEIASELEQHNSHWEAWYLRQRAAGVMPQFDEEAANGVQAAAGGLTQTALEC